MALEMNSMEFGRNEAGRKKLVTDIQEDIAAAKKQVSSETESLKKLIDANWAGADADKFKKKFQDNTNIIISNFERARTNIKTVFDEDARNFAKNQSKRNY